MIQTVVVTQRIAVIAKSVVIVYSVIKFT